MLFKMNRSYLLLTIFSASLGVSAAEAITRLESLAAIENDLQSIFDELETLKLDGNGEIKETVDKINTLSANIQQLTKKADAVKSSCGCDVTAAVANTPEAESAVWREDETPAEDCLDEYMASKTGCTYRGLNVGESWAEPRPAPAFNGSFVWRGAVRARAAAVVRALWGWGDGYTDGYTLYVGKHERNATITSINKWSPWKELQRRYTPGILSADRYVQFYLRIEAPGTLTFGRECDSKPLFTREVSIARGQEVRIQLQPYSPDGGKYLYCPPAA